MNRALGMTSTERSGRSSALRYKVLQLVLDRARECFKRRVSIAAVGMDTLFCSTSVTVELAIAVL